MKYMLMMNTPSGGPYQIFRWPQEDLKAHIAFMKGFAKKLGEAGELVSAEGLSGPDQAKFVRAGGGNPSRTACSRSRRSSSRATGSSTSSAPSELQGRPPPKPRPRPGPGGDSRPTWRSKCGR